MARFTSCRQFNGKCSCGVLDGKLVVALGVSPCNHPLFSFLA